MQVNNNQTSFKAVYFQRPALEIISKRVPSGKFYKIINSFEDKYKDSQFDIVIGALPDKLNRLDAMIIYKKQCKNKFFKYIEEGIFRRMFFTPDKFLEKVNKVYDKEAIPFAKYI